MVFSLGLDEMSRDPAGPGQVTAEVSAGFFSRLARRKLALGLMGKSKREREGGGGRISTYLANKNLRGHTRSHHARGEREREMFKSERLFFYQTSLEF